MSFLFLKLFKISKCINSNWAQSEDPSSFQGAQSAAVHGNGWRWLVLQSCGHSPQRGHTARLHRARERVGGEGGGGRDSVASTQKMAHASRKDCKVERLSRWFQMSLPLLASCYPITYSRNHLAGKPTFLPSLDCDSGSASTMFYSSPTLPNPHSVPGAWRFLADASCSQ